MVFGYEEEERVVSKWSMIKEYINSKNIGDIILRQDLIHHVYDGPMPARYRGSYGSTIDNYRKLLTNLGILEWVDRGQYKLHHYIRNELTTVHIRLLVQNGFTFEKGS